MARVSFNEAVDNSGNSEFFKLDKGKVARVQFLISEPEDIPTFYTHHLDVEAYQYGKDVQCNRIDYDNGDCELCKMGISRKTVCILIMYDLDSGKIKLWQRSKKFVNDKIIPLLNRYDLKETVVEIERSGEGLQTTYSLFAMPNDEPEDVTELDVPNDFDFAIWKKSNEDMLVWRDTGSFPQIESDEEEHEDVRPRRRETSREESSRSSRRSSRF